MPVPIVYRKSSENIMASFDWYDAAANVGYKKFYLGASDDNAGDKYFITTEEIYSSYQAYTLTTSGNTVTRDFTITFTTPTEIGGEALANYLLTIPATKTANGKIEYFHVRGATSTSMGSSTHATHSAGGSNESWKDCLKTTLTKTHFSANDTLKITVSCTSNDSSTIYFDPAGRATTTETGTGATINSKFEVYIPFIINI